MTMIRRTMLIGIAWALGTATAAQAGGDLLMPAADDYKSPIPAYSDVAPMMEKPRRIYLRGDIGWGHHDEPEIIEGQYSDLTEEEIEDTFTVGLGIGRYFSPNVRGDITVDYRTSAAVTAYMPDGGCCGSFLDNTDRTHDLSSLVVLANLYYDFNTSYARGSKDLNLYRKTRWTPYVGVGLGFVTHWSDEGSFSGNGLTGTIGDNTDTDVAAAFMTGVALNIRNHWNIDAGYRFLYMGSFETGNVVGTGGLPPGAGVQKVENIHAHEFRLGLRYDLR